MFIALSIVTTLVMLVGVFILIGMFTPNTKEDKKDG